MDEKTDEHLQCPLCLDTFRSPCETQCGHSFCNICIADFLQRGNKTCPVCRKTLERVHPSYTLRKIVESRFTKNELRSKSKGPDWDSIIDSLLNEQGTERNNKNIMREFVMARRQERLNDSERRDIGWFRSVLVLILVAGIAGYYFATSSSNSLPRENVLNSVKHEINLRATPSEKIPKSSSLNAFLESASLCNVTRVTTILNNLNPYVVNSAGIRMKINARLTKLRNLLDSRDSVGASALYLASRAGCLSVVRAIVDAGADIEAETKEGATSVYVAGEFGHANIVAYLISQGADLDSRFRSGANILVISSENGHAPVVKVIAEYATPKHRRNRAIRKNKLGDEVFVDCFAQGAYGMNALHLASMKGHEGVVAILLKFCHDEKSNRNFVDSVATDHITSLYLASRAGHLGIVRMLIQSGASVDIRTREAATALYVATEYGHGEIVQELVLNGKASVDLQMQSGATSLVIAAQKGFYSITEFLLSQKASPDIFGAGRMNALHFASSRRDTDMVRMLLEAGSNPDFVCEGGRTPLHLARYPSDNRVHGEDTLFVPVAALLLRFGANYTRRDDMDRPALDSESLEKVAVTLNVDSVWEVKCRVVPVLKASKHVKDTKPSPTVITLQSVSSIAEFRVRVSVLYDNWQLLGISILDSSANSSGEMVDPKFYHETFLGKFSKHGPRQRSFRRKNGFDIALEIVLA